MKKKILALCLVVVLAVTAVTGATLAYFTDTDEETNTFTVGGINIELIEKNEDGTEFTQDQELMPGEENAIVKDVTVKNISTKNDAYLWAEIWIPTALDAGETNAKDNNLHWNNFNTYKDENDNLVMCRMAEAEAKGYTLVAETMSKYLGEVDGYTGYRLWINNDVAHAPNGETYSLLYRVFMDKRVEQCTDENCTNSDECLVLVNGTHYDGDWEIIVNAFGIQKDGFTTIDQAIAAYDGEGAGKP